MNLSFDEIAMQELQDLWNGDDEQRLLFLSHYQLAQALGRTPEEWKEFLRHPKVNIWISEELEMFTQHQLKQLIHNATDNDRSVGAAQMINSLTKTLSEQDSDKSGPIIIYTYVPLLESQQLGTSVELRQATRDLFEAGGMMHGLTP
jgi:hypothetical protein